MAIVLNTLINKEKMPRFLEGKAGAKSLCSYMKAGAAEVHTVT
jgi:hypothetical protein